MHLTVNPWRAQPRGAGGEGELPHASAMNPIRFPPPRCRAPRARASGGGSRPRRDRRICPRPAAMPDIARSSVVLPTPFVPTMATTSPLATARSIQKNFGVAVARVELACLKHGRRVVRLGSRLAEIRLDNLGVVHDLLGRAVSDFTPWSSTAIRSQICVTVIELCSTKRSVGPQSQRSCTSRTMSLTFDVAEPGRHLVEEDHRVLGRPRSSARVDYGAR